MPRLDPPPGTVARHTAVKVLMREKVITSAAMLERLKGVKKIVPAGRSHGFYEEQSLLNIINDRRKLYELPPLKSLFEEEHKIVVRQATADDMSEVYEIAYKLFGNTTPAKDRIPLIQKVPEGNLVVLDNNCMVGFAHILPLQIGPLKHFLEGHIRGKDLTAESLDPFESGKVVNILIKSMGTYHEHPSVARSYGRALFIGLRRMLINWGYEGYIIRRIYATSETHSGIEAALEVPMQPLGRIPGSKGKKRFAFELDPASSVNPLMLEYRQALDEWCEIHPSKYDVAWKIYKDNETKLSMEEV